jgi:hypothetical protein
MSGSQINYRENYFQHPSLTKINGDPTCTSLAKLNKRMQSKRQVRTIHPRWRQPRTPWISQQCPMAAICLSKKRLGLRKNGTDSKSRTKYDAIQPQLPSINHIQPQISPGPRRKRSIRCLSPDLDSNLDAARRSRYCDWSTPPRQHGKSSSGARNRRSLL